jgi:DNA-binding NarL/FixJ family response regulator
VWTAVAGGIMGMFVSAVMAVIAQHQKLEYGKMALVKQSPMCRLLASSATEAQTDLRDGRLSLRRKIEKLVMVDNVPSRGSITVLIVDDHPITRAGLAAVLQTRPQYRVCGEASTVQEAVEQFDRLRPNITLMDLKLPDGYGVQAIRRIRLIDPDAKILVLTTYEGDEDIHQSLKAGAKGYLVKGASYETIFRALRKVEQGSTFLPQPVDSILKTRDAENLTGRERQVLSLIVAGKSNREIGELLNIKEVSVKAHITVILSRLQVSDRTQAVVAALKRGLEHL